MLLLIMLHSPPLPSPQAMSSPEDKAYEIMRELDVNYVLVIFGGLTGYASDGTAVYSHPHTHTHARTHTPTPTPILGFSTSLQISTSFCGWCELGEVQRREAISRRQIISPPRGNFVWTARAPPSCSTASCTRCVTIASERSTLSKVSVT